MKKYIVLLAVILISGTVLPGSASAAGDFLKPTSSFYFLQSWKESLGLAFSFSKESKLDYLEELNNKRISELQYDSNNDEQVVKMLVEKYENNYQKIEALAPDIKDKSQVAERIEANSVSQQETLARVYSQVPDQAKPAILNAEVNSSKNVSAVLEKVSPDKKENYDQKVQQIQKAQMVGKVERMEKESGNAGGSPEGRGPKPLNAIKVGNELNKINDTNGNGGSQGGAQQMQQAPMQSPVSQQ